MKLRLLSWAATGALLLAVSSAQAIVINLNPEGAMATTPGTIGHGEVAQYISGGTGLTGIASSYPNGATPAQACADTDHIWYQGAAGSPVVLGFLGRHDRMVIYAGIDHGPVPDENLEFILFGSNDLSSWEEGLIESIHDQGWDPATGEVGESDDYASVWKFSQAYQYVMVHQGDHLDPHFNSDDFEFDAVAAVPEPGTMAALGLGVLAIARRKFRKA